MSDDLTYKQWKAIKWLANTNKKHLFVAKKVGVDVATIRNWLKNPVFDAVLKREIDSIDKVDREFRRDKMRRLLPPLYDEISERVIEGKLGELPTERIVKIITDLQHELRLDTSGDGDATSKTQGVSVDEMIERMKNSNSGKRFAKKVPVEQPKKEEKSSERKPQILH
jgi:hypothetical protein